MVVGLVAAGWLAAGLAGAYTYVHRYDVYRGFPAPATPAGIARGTVHYERFVSHAIGGTHRYVVYLPPHYAAQAARGRRFPVLYLLHGYPGQPRVFIDAGALAVDANVLIAHHKMPPTILVMPAGKHSTFGGDTEWANGGAGRWMDYVMEVVHSVDRRFATLADRQHRGIAGLSEGGYGALNIALRNLNTFSIAESWSGYFNQTPTGVFAGQPAAAAANNPVGYVPSMAPRIRKLGFRAWLYQGITDTSPPSLMTGFAAELHRAGGDVHYGFFPGGHDWAIWRRQLPHMLVVAGKWFGQRPGGHAGFSHVGHHLSNTQLAAIQAKRIRRCLHRNIRPGDHVGLGCRLMRKHNGIPTPGPGRP